MESVQMRQMHQQKREGESKTECLTRCAPVTSRSPLKLDATHIAAIYHGTKSMLSTEKLTQNSEWRPARVEDRYEEDEESEKVLTRCAHGAVVAGGGDDDLGLNDVGVHAHLCVVVQGHQGPVGDCTTHVPAADIVLADNEVLDCGGVEELDIGCLPMVHNVSFQVDKQAMAHKRCDVHHLTAWQYSGEGFQTGSLVICCLVDNASSHDPQAETSQTSIKMLHCSCYNPND